MKCILCNGPIEKSITWLTIVIPSKQKYICPDCESKFTLIHTPICEQCGRTSRKSPCQACHSLAAQFPNRPLKKSRSIYTYNDFMKGVIANWKYRGDYMIVYVFAHIFRQKFMQYYKELLKQAIITPIPLSTERLRERRFNQAEALGQLLNTNQSQQLLIRTHTEKQSKKSRRERLQSKNPFIINTSKRIKQPVILIDDIYTTGTTLNQAATVLINKGCPAVYAFTLVRG